MDIIQQSNVMSYNTMRQDICRVYDFKPGWVARVAAMPLYQVQAIWRRFASLGFDPERIKEDGCKSRTTKNKLEKALDAMPADEVKHTTYLCTECKGWFIADNPELEECRYCGDTKILRGRFINENQ